MTWCEIQRSFIYLYQMSIANWSTLQDPPTSKCMLPLRHRVLVISHGCNHNIACHVIFHQTRHYFDPGIVLLAVVTWPTAGPENKLLEVLRIFTIITQRSHMVLFAQWNRVENHQNVEKVGNFHIKFVIKTLPLGGLVYFGVKQMRGGGGSLWFLKRYQTWKDYAERQLIIHEVYWHLEAISWEMLKMSNPDVASIIANLRLQLHIPGTKELNRCWNSNVR